MGQSGGESCVCVYLCKTISSSAKEAKRGALKGASQTLPLLHPYPHPSSEDPSTSLQAAERKDMMMCFMLEGTG